MGGKGPEFSTWTAHSSRGEGRAQDLLWGHIAMMESSLITSPARMRDFFLIKTHKENQ